MKKPFRYGCIVMDDEFCPRPELQAKLVRHIQDGQNVVVMGERRMGKSSLIYAAARELKQYQMLYIDLLNIRTLTDFCNRVVTAAAQMRDNATLAQRVLKFVARLRPTLSVDPENGMPVISVDAKTCENPQSVADIVSLIDRLAKSRNMFVVLDEFQEVKRLEDCDQVLALLLSKIQFLSDTCFIFSGSIRDEMIDIFTNPKSPFFKSALTLPVPSMDDEVFAPFLIDRFASGKRKADRAFIDAIFEFANRTTGDVQQLCSAVWNTTNTGDVLAAENIKMALKEIFNEESGVFELQTSRLTKYQFKALVALAKMGGRNVYSAEFMNVAELPSAATTGRSIKALQSDGIVYYCNREYRFFNPFFRAWLISKGY